jgi:hypothetical protein
MRETQKVLMYKLELLEQATINVRAQQKIDEVSQEGATLLLDIVHAKQLDPNSVADSTPVLMEFQRQLKMLARRMQ